METSEFAVELRKIEEKDDAMENSYAIFQIREAISRSQMFFKIEKGVLKNVANFAGKILCWSRFLIKKGLKKSATLLKKRLQCRCFPGKFEKKAFAS